MSKPRAATDVATKIGALPVLKSNNASSLSCWDVDGGIAKALLRILADVSIFFPGQL
jgi:hypothetical protein